MSELRRWLEDAPPSEVRRLLEVGQWARPSSAVLDQTLSRVRAGAVADPLDAAVPAGQAPWRIGIKWSVVGALLLGGIGVLALGLRTEQSASDAVEPPLGEQASVATTPPSTPSPVAADEPEPASVTNTPPTLEVEQPTAAKPAPQKRGVAAPTPVRANEAWAPNKVCKPAVVDQIRMLEQAKGLIQRGRGAEALAILDRYDAFGAGRCFVPESMKHRMDAYAQTGNASGAARTATSIKKQYPDTAQARAADAVLQQK